MKRNKLGKSRLSNKTVILRPEAEESGAEILRPKTPQDDNTFHSDSPEATLRLGKAFAKELQPGSVIALSGDLGSGKTTFIKGIALGLGLKNPDEVKSPTFALLHIYPTRIPLYHFDLYRLEKLEEIRNIGLEEFVSDPRVITCIEWAEKARALLPFSSIGVILKTLGSHTRRITVRPFHNRRRE